RGRAACRSAWCGAADSRARYCTGCRRRARRTTTSGPRKADAAAPLGGAAESGFHVLLPDLLSAGAGFGAGDDHLAADGAGDAQVPVDFQGLQDAASKSDADYSGILARRRSVGRRVGFDRSLFADVFRADRALARSSVWTC